MNGPIGARWSQKKWKENVRICTLLVSRLNNTGGRKEEKYFIWSRVIYRLIAVLSCGRERGGEKKGKKVGGGNEMETNRRRNTAEVFICIQVIYGGLAIRPNLKEEAIKMLFFADDEEERRASSERRGGKVRLYLYPADLQF